ncbi:MAG: hypothetical protein QOE31_2753 [Solirubrobacteraceae bacterium]|nr:hypothetical protein [Solirubrobacteraceae bacterium]
MTVQRQVLDGKDGRGGFRTCDLSCVEPRRNVTDLPFFRRICVFTDRTCTKHLYLPASADEDVAGAILLVAGNAPTSMSSASRGRT